MKRLFVMAIVSMLAFSPVVAQAQATESDIEILGGVESDDLLQDSEAVPEENTATESVEDSGNTESSGDEVIKVVGEDGSISEVNLDEGGKAKDINKDDEVKVTSDDVPYLALGADLNADQKQKVLDLMGIGDKDLSGYDVVTVTNAEEHQYLDGYIDSATIGTKALSSVLIMEGEAGSGISVSTKNINFCTVGMYKNALATAGLTDAEVIVAGPFELSGTAALIGAMKAYSQMTGEAIDTGALDTALDELVLTGSVREKYDALSGGEAEELIAYLKGKVLSEDLSDDQIKKLIKDGAEVYGVSLSDDEINSIVGFLDKLKDIDIDEEEIMGYAEDLYEKFKDVKIDEETQNFFLQIINAIINFFKKLFGAIG